MELKQSISEKVRKLFHLENGQYKCSIDQNCKYAPKSLIITNCLRHIKQHHMASYKVLQLGKPVEPEEESIRARKRARFDDDYATVRISKQKFIGGLIKLFTVHGLAFRAMEWEGLRDIIEPLLEAFQIKLNQHNIVELVKDISTTIDNSIKEEICDKLISIKFDMTSKLNRSVLALSAQHYNELKLERRSLGVIELHDRHTSTYLKEKIEDLCAKFGIKRTQIYSATVDNGRNVVKAVDLMKDLPDDHESTDDVLPTEPLIDMDDLEDDYHGRDHLMQLTDAYEETLKEHKVECIRCGSHTINLVVNDVTAASIHNETLKNIVKIVKAFRKIEYKQAFKITKTPLPPIPNRTRWNSFHSMSSVLLEHREFYTNLGSQYKELDLFDYWDFIEEYRDAFQPLYEASLKSQQMECSISQFHVEWLKAYGKVRSIRANRFTDNILQSMENRQKTLMNNNAYKAALYMDPRFMYNGSELFKPHEKSEIVSYLLGVWKKINVNYPDGISASVSTTDEADEPINTSFDINGLFTELFGQGSSRRTCSTNSIEDKLQQIQFQDRVSPADENFNTIHYWYTQKVRDERLWKIAQIVFAAASSQAAIERDFSAYNLVFTNQRNRLGSDTVESIMKIRLNKALLESAVRNTYKEKP